MYWVIASEVFAHGLGLLDRKLRSVFETEDLGHLSLTTSLHTSCETSEGDSKYDLDCTHWSETNGRVLV